MKYRYTYQNRCWTKIVTGIVFLFLFSTLLLHRSFKKNQEGSLAIVFIIDQLSWRTLHQITPYMQGGIKTLLEHGMQFTQAFFPYAATATGPGHATLSTGTLPRVHGIIDNSWRDEHDQKIACDDDLSPDATVLFSHEPSGKSAHHMRVDTISDHLMSTIPSVCYAFSIKSRSAITTAGKKGKAFWFDKKRGNFVSSKAYFSELPSWVIDFNQKYYPQQPLSWQTTYPLNSAAYQFPDARNYTFARQPTRIDPHNPHYHNGHKKFTYMPQSNKHLLQFVQNSIEHTLDTPTNVLLWISFSGPDMVGHIYGPQSVEYIDTLYHIDHYLADFLSWITTHFAQYKKLFILTADHGGTPLPELAQQNGHPQAQRIYTPDLEKEVNEYLQQKYAVDTLVHLIDPPALYLSQHTLSRFNAQEQEQIITDVKTYLLQKSYIKNVWHAQELCAERQTSETGHTVEELYYNSFYPGRSSQLLIQQQPYCLLSKHTHGTSHLSPYEYTTHVPLLVYSPDHKHAAALHSDPVSIEQVAPTLASFFGIHKPCTCLYDPLPYEQK